MFKTLLFLGILSFSLTGCVTPYQPSGFGGGYSDMALSQDMYKVSYRGNGYTSKDSVQEMLLKRCAELTLNAGYTYFIIISGNTDTRNYSFETPTTVNSNSYGNFSGNGINYGNGFSSFNGNMYGNTRTTINPGQHISFDKHQSAVVIKMFKSNKGLPLALDAKIIFNQGKLS